MSGIHRVDGNGSKHRRRAADAARRRALRSARQDDRLVQDQPAAVLGVDIEERLDRLAIGRAADLAEKPLGLLQRRQTLAHLVAIRLHGVGLRHDLLLLDHVLEDEHDLVSRGAVQIGAAAEFGDLLGRLGGFRRDRREAGRDDDAFGLLGAALQRLDAGRRGEADQQLRLHALALHFLEHAAGREGMRRDRDDVGIGALHVAHLGREGGVVEQPFGRSERPGSPLRFSLAPS